MARQYNQGDTYYPVFVEPTTDVSSVDLLIMRLDDGFYWDFNDSTFKDSGWTTKIQALSEKTEGIWVWTTGWTIPSENKTYLTIFKDDVPTIYTGHEIQVINNTQLVDDIWDETLTGSNHNVATSAGRRLRQVEASFVLASGVINTVTNGHTFILDAGAVATADYYIGARLTIIEGTGVGQSRIIIGYTSGKVVTLDSDFIINPDTSSLYEIDAADVHVSLSDSDLAKGFVATYTNTTTITLDSVAVATTNYYKGAIIIFTHGAGAGQSREITGYTSGRVITMSPALETVLDTTTVYHIQAAVSAAEIAKEVQTEMEENGASLLDTIRDELANGSDGLTALKSAIDAIPTTAMRGTDSANTTTPPTTSAIVTAIMDEAISSFTGTPTTFKEFIYLILQIGKNKLIYDKLTDKMALYEDNSSDKKWESDMTDDASNAIRGKGA